MLQKSTAMTTSTDEIMKTPKINNFFSLPLLEFLTAISLPLFSRSRFFNLTQSLSSTNKSKLHKSTTNLIFEFSKASISEEEHQEERKIMVRQLKLSRSFRSIKPHSAQNSNPIIEIEKLAETERNSKEVTSWCVYLIASANPPLKTYVGVTNDFPRRLKQHNGELRGGAKASRAGRPWICACLIQGFRSQSEACEFESKWKLISRKLPRKQKSDSNKGLEDKGRLLLLRHRHAAMEKLNHSFDSGHLEVDWQLSPF